MSMRRFYSRKKTLWFQKSREKWIKLGSRNTSFFHTQTIIRRKRNKIHDLHLPSGEWCTDPATLQTKAIELFKDLFCTTESLSGTEKGYIRSGLDEERRWELSKHVTKDEVHRALMGMKSYTAPGPDRFQPIFFKMFWEEVSHDTWQFVKRPLRGVPLILK